MDRQCCKRCLCHAPSGASPAVSPPFSPSFPCGWPICPQLGAAISHISSHRVYPVGCIILRLLVIRKPVQQVQHEVSYCSWAALTALFSAAPNPPLTITSPRASTHPCLKQSGLWMAVVWALHAPHMPFMPNALIKQPEESILLAQGFSRTVLEPKSSQLGNKQSGAK